MKKQGFTLIELLAVITIIGILAIIVTPEIMDSFKEGTDDTMIIQENQVKDSTNLFIEDFCRNPISSAHKAKCSQYEGALTAGKVYFCLKPLQNGITVDGFGTESYLDKVYYRTGVPCTGIIVYNKSGNVYSNGKVYLVCKNEEDSAYAYTTEGYETYRAQINACMN